MIVELTFSSEQAMRRSVTVLTDLGYRLDRNRQRHDNMAFGTQGAIGAQELTVTVRTPSDADPVALHRLAAQIDPGARMRLRPPSSVPVAA